jgi:hypothetical protein
MEVKDYCRNMEMELTNWKSKLYDLIRKMDTHPTGDKEQIYEEINGLHILMTQLEDRLDKLRTSCPTDWKPASEEEFRGKMGTLEEQYKKVAQEHFDYEFGG